MRNELNQGVSDIFWLVHNYQYWVCDLARGGLDVLPTGIGRNARPEFRDHPRRSEGNVFPCTPTTQVVGNCLQFGTLYRTKNHESGAAIEWAARDQPNLTMADPTDLSTDRADPHFACRTAMNWGYGERPLMAESGP